MKSQETYYVLYRTYMGRSDTVVHSFHATKEDAEEHETIMRAFDNSEGFDQFTYKVEAREAKELRLLMAALDTRQAISNMGRPDPGFRWESPSGMIHAGGLLSMTTACGVPVGPSKSSDWKAVDHDLRITCLNCKNTLMTDEQKEERREFTKRHRMALAAQA